MKKLLLALFVASVWFGASSDTAEARHGRRVRHNYKAARQVYRHAKVRHHYGYQGYRGYTGVYVQAPHARHHHGRAAVYYVQPHHSFGVGAYYGGVHVRW